MPRFDMEQAYSLLWSILYPRQAIILKQLFCYEVFERYDMETTAEHFFKKCQVVKLGIFFD